MRSVLIVTRTRDRPQLLERAIKSVLHQTTKEWVHIIVNDGGEKEHVNRLAEKYSTRYDGRLQIVHNDVSHGMERASNIGISMENSEYILIHDDDDSLDASFLECTLKYLQASPHSTIQGVCTWAYKMEESIDGDRVTILSKKVFREIRGCLSFNDVCGLNPIPPISFVFRRQAYMQIGPFDESLPVLGDWDFLLRFLAKFDIGIIPEPLANYHIRNNATGVLSNSINERSEQFILFTKMIRNRFAREHENKTIGLLVQQGEQMQYLQLLQRLYTHPILGRVIRFWSKFVNNKIPNSPL